jgi:hypothetical protein
MPRRRFSERSSRTDHEIRFDAIDVELEEAAAAALEIEVPSRTGQLAQADKPAARGAAGSIDACAPGRKPQNALCTGRLSRPPQSFDLGRYDHRVRVRANHAGEALKQHRRQP